MILYMHIMVYRISPYGCGPITIGLPPSPFLLYFDSVSQTAARNTSECLHIPSHFHSLPMDTEIGSVLRTEPQTLPPQAFPKHPTSAAIGIDEYPIGGNENIPVFNVRYQRTTYLYYSTQAGQQIRRRWVAIKRRL
ncbi:hypothetical protein EDD18DRAFT_1110481 [Armillaria luteobubalina]|uniref:Uncharacterized protein n=1 Tax=Armillaria luteobubalina TaxID=153913 RepID=A0AA39PPG0_9AGAR|nr:hypothetical protein EDD18DRAFT_1110481 [Armillaria luteobubalina]